MIVSATLSPTSAQSSAQSAAFGVNGTSGGSSFADSLISASAAQPVSGPDTTRNANRSFRHGRLSIDMHADGQRINGMSYFDEAGQKLTTSGFWPQDILRQCERFNIPLSDLHGLGPQLDAAGVRYKPYEQYAGTGSNHGIDLDDLATGGMGTAYDWTQDALVHLKGPSARSQLEADQALAQRLGLRPVLGMLSGTSSPSGTGQVIGAAAAAAPTTFAPSAVDAVSTVASSPAAQAMTTLDELLQLITQVKTSLQHTAMVQGTPPAATVSNSSPSLPATTGNAAPDTSTTQRFSQMKSLLEQLLAQR